MQDPSIFAQINPQFPEQEQLKCPRCDSINTKFCYYNNYNLSQPRHYCKSCKRYWTKGGTLRNIPVGGGSRKNTKRKKSSVTVNSLANDPKPEPGFDKPGSGPGFDQSSRVIDLTNGPFSSLLGSNDSQFGNLLELKTLNPDNNESSLQLNGSNSGPGPGLGSGSGLDGGNNAYLGVQNSGDSNSWKFGRSSSGLVSGSDTGPQNDTYLDVQNGGDSNCWKLATNLNPNSGLGSGSTSDAGLQSGNNANLGVRNGGDSNCWKLATNLNPTSGLGSGSTSDPGLQSGNNANLGVQNGGDSDCYKFARNPNPNSGLVAGLQSGNGAYLGQNDGGSNFWKFARNLSSNSRVGPVTGSDTTPQNENNAYIGDSSSGQCPSSSLGLGTVAGPQNRNNVYLGQNSGDSNCWKFARNPNFSSGLGLGSDTGSGSDARPQNGNNSTYLEW